LCFFFQEFGVTPAAANNSPLNIPCIYPYFRDGGSAQYAVNDYFVELIAGSEDNFYAAYPERSSADLMLLAAKYRSAAAKGELDKLEISPALEARRTEFEKFQRDSPQHIDNFLSEVMDKLGKKRIFMMASTVLLHGIAEKGLKKGMRNLFAPDSVILSGGGSKGAVVPDNWQELVKEFFGVKRITMLYAMSEMAAQFPMCEFGHYHCPPSVIPFILDPDTAKPLPRTGTVTGRFAFYDLIPDARWGGFITGDEVTMSWDVPCLCGRSSPYLDSKIQRFSEKAKNGDSDEKINCAATPDAYDEALDFLNENTI